MNCEFKKENGCFKCISCEFEVCGDFPNGIKRNCVKITKKDKIINNAKNVTQAAIDVAKGNTVEKDMQEKRMEICRSCEHFCKNKCKLCGCLLNFKTRVESANCPIGKW